MYEKNSRETQRKRRKPGITNICDTSQVEIFLRTFLKLSQNFYRLLNIDEKYENFPKHSFSTIFRDFSVFLSSLLIFSLIIFNLSEFYEKSQKNGENLRKFLKNCEKYFCTKYLYGKNPQQSKRRRLKHRSFSLCNSYPVKLKFITPA